MANIYFTDYFTIRNVINFYCVIPRIGNLYFAVLSVANFYFIRSFRNAAKNFCLTTYI